MFKKQLVFLFYLLMISWQQLAGQPPIYANFETITMDDGLSSPLVYNIMQDKKGFIWLCTDHGLNRYDGYHFIVYKNNNLDSNSISSDLTRCAFEDSKQRLWISTADNGLNYFDKFHHRFYHFLNGAQVESIQNDKENNLWAIFNLNTIIKIKIKETKDALSNRTTVTLDTQHIKTFNSSAKLYRDSKNSLYVITYTNIFRITYNKQFNKYVFDTLFSYDDITPTLPQFFENKTTGSLYIQLRKKIIEFPYGNFKNQRTIFSADSIYYSFIDNQQRLWCQTSYETAPVISVTQIDLKTQIIRKVVSTDERNDKLIANMHADYQDENGTLWIGTSFGILKYSDVQNRFNLTLTNAIFHGFRLVKDSGIQVSRNAILWMNKKQIVTHIDTLQHYHNTYYTSIVPYFQDVDSLGYEWYGDGLNLIQHDPASGKIIQSFALQDASNPTINKKIAALKKNPPPLLLYLLGFHISHNYVWMLLDDLLISFNTKTNKFSSYFSIQSRKENNINLSYYDDGNNLWITSATGSCYCLNIYSGKAIRYTFKKKEVHSFCNDPKQPEKYIWLGTTFGLSRMDKKTGICTNYSGSFGLPNTYIYGILNDSLGNLWISSDVGLCRFHIADSTTENFSVADGLQSNQFNEYSFYKTKDGLMFFGGIKGLNFFKPENIKPLNQPKTILIDYKILGTSANYGAANSILQKDVAYTNNITTRYSKNVITIEFAGINYSKKGRLKYRYKLNNLNEDWNYAGTINTANYSNLSPGTYRFVVEASNDGNNWGQANTQLQLTITPLWWQTWLFKIFVLLVAVALSYLIYKYRLNQVLQVERVRNRIASDLHDEIGSTLSTISIYSKIVHNQLKKEQNKATSLIEKIADNSSEAMQAMSEIVWSVNAKNDKFENIIIRMQTLATQVLEAKDYKVHFKASEKVLNLNLKMQKRRDFYLIYKEVINNIAKHAHGKNVWIELQLNGNHLILTIKDDGVGFDNTNVRKESNGLLNMQQRATAINGKFCVTTSKNENSTLVELNFIYN